ncbi:putative plastoquinol--plastocyanin reductase [Helianthus annuus]|nr:putative plastoquinol--plastocyanin reductase [Helianthus annuus]
MNSVLTRNQTDSCLPLCSGGGGGGTPAKDALGNDIVATEWLKTHGPGDRTLSQGLKVIMV